MLRFINIGKLTYNMPKKKKRKKALPNERLQITVANAEGKSYANFKPWARYDFVDLGSDIPPIRLNHTRNIHPEWYLLGIDKRYDLCKTNGTLDLVAGEAFEVLQLLRNESVQRFNADFFFSEFDPQAVPYVLQLIYQKLGENGQLVISQRKWDVNQYAQLVQAIGFTISKPKPMQRSQCTYSRQAGINYENVEDLESLARGVPTMLNAEVAASPHLQRYLQDPSVWTPMRFKAQKNL